LVEALVKEGVGRSAAHRFAASKPDLCRRYLDWLPFAEVRTTRGTWLANAIEHEFGPPKGLARREAQARKIRAAEERQTKPAQSHDSDRSRENFERLRVTYARLEEMHPEATEGFRIAFDAEQSKARKFAETLTEKGRALFFEQATSDEFRLTAFEKWLKGEGRKYTSMTRDDGNPDGREYPRTDEKEFAERAA